MKLLRDGMDKLHPLFTKGGKLELLYPLYEMADTFLYTTPDVSKGRAHIRDALDLKRLMITVVVALTPCILMAMYNTGLQANLAMEKMGATAIDGWRGFVLGLIGMGYDSSSILDNFLHGALYFIPVFIVTNLAGGLCEVIFSVLRKHEINEGFLVTGMLFPLTLPPNIPLWQVAVGIAFGVVFGKEVFGGTGKNFLNPALTARAFLFFAYPAQISGDSVWVALDGFSGATPLSLAATGGMDLLSSQVTWFDAFVGTIPGSMGETSALACLFGAFVLILTGIGSWRVMLGMLVGGAAFSLFLSLFSSSTNLMLQIGPAWHLVLGGFAFGLVFMATDPVSSAMTRKGMYIYGLLIGVMAILVRSLNPAFPEGVMLSILFGNIFAPLIDHYVVKSRINKRKLRNIEVKDV